MAITRQEQFSGTKDVEAHLQFDESSLASYLGEHIEGFAGPLRVKRFKGGQSNPTYRIETKPYTYVLRRKPPGKLLPSAHAVDREFKIMSALHTFGYPVPKMHTFCDDVNIVGTPFYLSLIHI